MGRCVRRGLLQRESYWPLARRWAHTSFPSRAARGHEGARAHRLLPAPRLTGPGAAYRGTPCAGCGPWAERRAAELARCGAGLGVERLAGGGFPRTDPRGPVPVDNRTVFFLSHARLSAADTRGPRCCPIGEGASVKTQCLTRPRALTARALALAPAFLRETRTSGSRVGHPPRVSGLASGQSHGRRTREGPKRHLPWPMPV